ncbi:hypothetical protein OZY43_00745 [Lactobacillus sp. ESL0785]|uniref:hypothetical protein n=1 Tax=Lactobacillus sp. ESL0785 TaxID=2983232 RepID=UPI0023F89037|nr:hypothetical protein [Lactobacillus sp. ESL0785]WEV70998.1 hypothetical protein OZY43_00745 [Lactobacillus sp. ESL0785]
METWSTLLKGLTANECSQCINANVYIRYVYFGATVVYRPAPQKIIVLKKPSDTLASYVTTFLV